eukprot:gene9429-9594_t
MQQKKLSHKERRRMQQEAARLAREQKKLGRKAVKQRQQQQQQGQEVEQPQDGQDTAVMSGPEGVAESVEQLPQQQRDGAAVAVAEPLSKHQQPAGCGNGVPLAAAGRAESDDTGSSNSTWTDVAPPAAASPPNHTMGCFGGGYRGLDPLSPKSSLASGTAGPAATPARTLHRRFSSLGSLSAFTSSAKGGLTSLFTNWPGRQNSRDRENLDSLATQALNGLVQGAAEGQAAGAAAGYGRGGDRTPHELPPPRPASAMAVIGNAVGGSNEDDGTTQQPQQPQQPPPLPPLSPTIRGLGGHVGGLISPGPGGLMSSSTVGFTIPEERPVMLQDPPTAAGSAARGAPHLQQRPEQRYAGGDVAADDGGKGPGAWGGQSELPDPFAGPAATSFLETAAGPADVDAEGDSALMSGLEHQSEHQRRMRRPLQRANSDDFVVRLGSAGRLTPPDVELLHLDKGFAAPVAAQAPLHAQSGGAGVDSTLTQPAAANTASAATAASSDPFAAAAVPSRNQPLSVSHCLASFFLREEVTWDCPKEKALWKEQQRQLSVRGVGVGDSGGGCCCASPLDPAGVAIPGAAAAGECDAGPVYKQVSFSLHDPQVILVPGSVEQRGTDVAAALAGTQPFTRPLTCSGVALLLTAQLGDVGLPADASGALIQHWAQLVLNCMADLVLHEGGLTGLRAMMAGGLSLLRDSDAAAVRASPHPDPADDAAGGGWKVRGHLPVAASYWEYPAADGAGAEEQVYTTSTERISPNLASFCSTTAEGGALLLQQRALGCEQAAAVSPEKQLVRQQLGPGPSQAQGGEEDMFTMDEDEDEQTGLGLAADPVQGWEADGGTGEGEGASAVTGIQQVLRGPSLFRNQPVHIAAPRPRAADAAGPAGSLTGASPAAGSTPGSLRRSSLRRKSATFSRSAHKSYRVYLPPPVLMLHLKRFQHDGKGRLSKLDTVVRFDFHLDLGPYMADTAPGVAATVDPDGGEAGWPAGDGGRAGGPGGGACAAAGGSRSLMYDLGDPVALDLVVLCGMG